MATMKIGGGRSGPQQWVAYANGIYVDVNTSEGYFTHTPMYIASLGGNSSHWSTVGGSSIYLPTINGFRVYVKWMDNSPLTPAQAQSLGWHINWIGMEQIP